MATAESFTDYIYKMEWDERDAYLMGLAKLKVEGMTYVKIGSLLGGYSGKEIGKNIGGHVGRYERLLDHNFAKLEESLKKNDPDYDYITDRRTVLQEMCALHMGGEEIKMTLNQLMNLESTT